MLCPEAKPRANLGNNDMLENCPWHLSPTIQISRQTIQQIIFGTTSSRNHAQQDTIPFSSIRITKNSMSSLGTKSVYTC